MNEKIKAITIGGLEILAGAGMIITAATGTETMIKGLEGTAPFLYISGSSLILGGAGLILNEYYSSKKLKAEDKY
jgi:hypothetical protein